MKIRSWLNAKGQEAFYEGVIVGAVVGIVLTTLLQIINWVW